MKYIILESKTTYMQWFKSNLTPKDVMFLKELGAVERHSQFNIFTRAWWVEMCASFEKLGKEKQSDYCLRRSIEGRK